MPEERSVRLPTGTRFDPGGIAKGLVADLVTARLHELGATTTQVDVGGDVRLCGPTWSEQIWECRVDGTLGNHEAARISTPQGGVATRRSVPRPWPRSDPETPRLLSSSTDRPAIAELGSVTVVAPTLWWAEAAAKATLVSGRHDGRRLLEQLGLNGVLVGGGATPRFEIVMAPATIG